MNLWDVLILVMVGVCVIAAVLHGRKRKKQGKCTCGCDGCSGCDQKK